MPSSFRKEIVGQEVKIIASYNPNRKLLQIINESEDIIYISKDPMYVMENGIPLYPFESIVFDVADADEPEMAFFAVSTGTASPVRIYENLIG